MTTLSFVSLTPHKSPFFSMVNLANCGCDGDGDGGIEDGGDSWCWCSGSGWNLVAIFWVMYVLLWLFLVDYGRWGQYQDLSSGEQSVKKN